MFLFAFLFTAHAQETNRAEVFNLKNGVALDGYDPVSYFKADKPQRGSSSISTEYKGVIYQFASESNRAAFLSNPENYEPGFGGYCAYSLLDGDLNGVNPRNFKIYDGKLLLFDTMMFGMINAKNRWDKEIENTEGGEQELFLRAKDHWSSIGK